jgi:hypothetical protein
MPVAMVMVLLLELSLVRESVLAGEDDFLTIW